MKWFCSLFAIRRSSITHLVLSPAPPSKKVRNPCFPFLLGTTTVPRETAYVKIWGRHHGAFWEMCEWRMCNVYKL